MSLQEASPAYLLADDDRRAAILTSATMRAADLLGLTNAALARVLGLSPASVTRMSRGDFTLGPDSKAFELAQYFVRLFRSVDAISGGDDAAARSWMVAHNTALQGRPVDLIQTIVGLTRTVDYVDARRALV
jgi:uncharacterized protein (DUF2384 family)